MTDLEMTKLCAEAFDFKVEPCWINGILYMGWEYLRDDGSDAQGHLVPGRPLYKPYDPLHDDAQAMALVKKFGLSVWGSDRAVQEWKWHAETQIDPADKGYAIGHGDNLNRAIVEAVAKMAR